MKYAAKLFLCMLFIAGYAMAQNIALCTIATGKYGFFVKNFIESARKNFLPDRNVRFFIFTDQILPVEGDDITIVRWPHKKWPFSTMMRFKAYCEYANLFDNMDYVYACDVDAAFVDKIGDEILGDTVAVLHPGYYQKDLQESELIHSLIEKNPKSTIFLKPNQANKQYFAGGFYGGRTAFFKQIVSECYENINKDLRAKIIAPWHDETYLNYYFLHHPPHVKLTPSYCYPEEALTRPVYRHIKSETPKIVVLSKDHLQVRSSEQCLDDREFVILIPSYNNTKYYKANLDSVFKQNYKKYRVVYVDDCSPDGTGQAVCNYISEIRQTDITTIVRNTDRKLALANIYHNILAHCMDHEIVVMLDGDDELVDENVLLRLNDEYKKNDIWFTYGNCWFSAVKMACPWSKSIDDIAIELNNFRGWDGAATHLRTFYAWIFKKIKTEDLMVDGNFFKMTYDVAMFMPILEMSGYHHKFIQEVLYLYNDENPLNDHKINSRLQLDINRHIRNALPKYQPITKLEYFDKVLKLGSNNDGGCKVEIAAILNDFIASSLKTYPQPIVFALLDRLPVLNANLIEKLDLVAIANSRGYSFLSRYLLVKVFNYDASLLNETIYYCHDQSQDFSVENFKFTQWLGRLISERYKMTPTTVAQDVNAVSFNGLTPLITASSEGLPDMVDKLLLFGADKNFMLKSGKKAIDFAKGRNEQWYTEIIERLSN